MPQEQQGKNTQVTKNLNAGNISDSKIKEEPQCHIHDKVDFDETNDIRENVCVNDEPLKEFEDKHYCLFHFPTKEKDITKFEEKFRARLKEIEVKITSIEKLPDNEREEAKNGISYDFRYIWFPSKANLKYYKFSSIVDFDTATFTSDADFSNTTFTDVASFRRITFASTANFKWAKFLDTPYFNETIFKSHAYFSSATFTSYADFSWGIFSSDVVFSWAKFLETSQSYFSETRFCKTVDFNYAFLAGYLAFEGNKIEKVFLDKKEENQEAVLNLQSAQLEKPERISFHRVRLCPSWFVNIDSRKMIFTDIDWKNYESTTNNSNITTEIKSLEKRKISEPSRLLEIACRQLAANAEENNRYEEAAKFRYMAMETKRLEKDSFWTIEWWYRFSSGYGENWKRAAFVLLGVLLFFGLLYWSPLSAFDYGAAKEQTIAAQAEVEKKNETADASVSSRRMNLGEGLVHSLFVAALQRPEPKPADNLTKLFIILETIFAPLQAALLALAIRRNLMR